MKLTQNLYNIFISYSKHDSWIAKQINGHIKCIGADSFLYETDTDIGDKFEDKIITNLKTCKELVVLFTPWSKDKKYIWVEIGAAIVLDIRIISIYYGLEEKELLEDSTVPNEIKNTSLILLNDIDLYFDQLKKRINETRRTC